MLIFTRIVVGVYLVAINVYSFMLLRAQKTSEDECGDKPKVRDGSLFITAVLGGALGIYIAMFVFKFRLRSLFLMVFMPVLTVATAYIVCVAFMNDFWFIRTYADLVAKAF